MGRVEKERDLLIFDTSILNTFFFFFPSPTAEITAWLLVKSGQHSPTVEGLI